MREEKVKNDVEVAVPGMPHAHPGITPPPRPRPAPPVRWENRIKATSAPISTAKGVVKERALSPGTRVTSRCAHDKRGEGNPRPNKELGYLGRGSTVTVSVDMAGRTPRAAAAAAAVAFFFLAARLTAGDFRDFGFGLPGFGAARPAADLALRTCPPRTGASVTGPGSAMAWSRLAAPRGELTGSNLTCHRNLSPVARGR